MTLVEGADVGAAVAALVPMADEEPVAEGRVVRVSVRERVGSIVDAVRRLSEAGIGVDDLGVRRPTLDDVFLSLTGHAAEDGSPEPESSDATADVSAHSDSEEPG